MFKSMEQQERLEAMFKELSGGKKPTNTDLLRAADEKTALTNDELKESFRKKVWSYFAWLIRSVTPIYKLRGGGKSARLFYIF